MREALQSLVERVQGIRPTWPQAPQAAQDKEQVWYTGLAVCPVDFSKQLVNLQLSLQAPGASQTNAQTSEAAAVSESSVPEASELAGQPALH